MKWIAELYIKDKGETYYPEEPDAFVEVSTRKEAFNMMFQYVTTMVGDDQFYKILVYTKGGQR